MYLKLCKTPALMLISRLLCNIWMRVRRGFMLVLLLLSGDHI